MFTYILGIHFVRFSSLRWIIRTEIIFSLIHYIILYFHIYCTTCNKVIFDALVNDQNYNLLFHSLFFRIHKLQDYGVYLLVLEIMRHFYFLCILLHLRYIFYKFYKIENSSTHLTSSFPFCIFNTIFFN